jgi:enolase
MSASTVIKHVEALKVFDSRGNPTIEVGIKTDKGFARAAAPSGASRGKWEVEQYPPGGIDQAINLVETLIKPRLVGLRADEQETVDELLHELDGTSNFGKIGGNTACAVSLATALAAASSKAIHLFEQLSRTTSKELPLPLGNVLGGGRHARTGKTDIQEFLVLPVGATTFLRAAEANAKVHSKIARLLQAKGNPATGKGDEGAWIADLTTDHAFETVSKACEEVSADTGVSLRIGADIAASTLWNEEQKAYVYDKDAKRLNEGEQIDHMRSLIDRYDLIYLEDPFNEESFESFSELTRTVHDTLICGDDLFVTSQARLKKGKTMNAGNAIIIKPNQVGTITDASKTAKLAAQFGYVPVTSHRSGDTPGPELAHMAIAFGSPIIKTGVVGGERVAKINELISIEHESYKSKPLKLAKIPHIMN